MLRRHLIETFKVFGLLGIFWTQSAHCDSSTPYGTPLSLRLIDVETKISPIPVLFLNKKASIVIEGVGRLNERNEIQQNTQSIDTDGDIKLIYSTYVNEREVANGTFLLSNTREDISTVYSPSNVDVGLVEVDEPGLNSIRVVLYHVSNEDIVQTSITLDIRSYRQSTASIPVFLGFGLFLIFKVHVIHSLFLAMFVGSWIVEGSMINGFRAIFDTYLLQAATDSDHVLIFLFTTGILTLTAMVKRSGGTAAVIKSLNGHSSKTRVAQFVIFSMGLIFFFDPSVSVMIVGSVIGPIFKGFPLSSEKLSFLVDTTAAPVASILPQSSWVRFTTNLMEEEIGKMTELGYEELDDMNGYHLVLSSVKYQFYPILVLGLTFLQILTGREMGPILDTENKARLSYNISDQSHQTRSTPRQRLWNWYIPMIILNTFIWITFSQMSSDNSTSRGTTTWLLSVVATIIFTQIIFIFQKRSGKVPFLGDYLHRNERNTIAYLTDTFPSASGSTSIPYNPSSKSEDTNDYLKRVDDDCQKILQMNTEEEANGVGEKNQFGCSKEPSLLDLQGGVECLIQGTTKAVPFILLLLFTWATGSVYQTLGLDRVIVSWILSDSISSEMLPIAVFFSSFLLAVITGSSWYTVSVLIQTTMTPLADSLGGDSKGVGLVLASILSGTAAGEHIGPFSETTILSALVSGSDVRVHFLTQAPYALFVLVLSLLVGTLPVSYGSFPYYVAYIIGFVILLIFVIFVCRQVKRYQSTTIGHARSRPITRIVHPMIAAEIENNEERSVMLATPKFMDELFDKENQPQDETMNEVSVMSSSTQEGTEVVETINGEACIHIRKKGHNRRSFKKKLEEINENGGDPITGLVEDGILPQNYRSQSQRTPLGQKLPSPNELSDVTRENKKRLIEATIKKAELDGNVFSDSLRTFLRTAQFNLGYMLDDHESAEITGSGSGESSGDDSLDNLMMNIATKGWRARINNLLRDGPVPSAGEDYTTDGASGMIESDDSATSFGGHDPSSYYSRNGDIASCSSSATGPSTYTTGTSQLLNPLQFEKSRQSLHEWNETEDFFTTPDDFSAETYTKASF